MFGIARFMGLVSTHVFRRPMLGFSDEQYEGRVLEDCVGDHSVNGKKKATPTRPSARLVWLRGRSRAFWSRGKFARVLS